MTNAHPPGSNWQRFWVPSTGVIDLSDGGFLVDPTAPYASRSEAKQLGDLGHYSALVLLGEPGIGKSTALQAEVKRLQAQETRDFVLMYIDLRAYSSESLLCRKIFESPEFLNWVAGNTDLILQLDSLDEALLRIDTIASFLADELPRLPTKRLSLRIACRTAVWPSATLQPSLLSIWGEAGVGVFELAPLRRRDVTAAAQATGIDADRFVSELYSANVVPLAIRPLTLNFLLEIFKKEQGLPRKARDIYLRGCLMLCDEQSASRRDAGRFGAHTGVQRLRVAARIAAATMLANRYAIWTGPASGQIPQEDIPLNAIAGVHEHGDFPSFQVTEACVRETLDTGLFTSRGTNRMGWSHQGYAEFLAAEYLNVKGVCTNNILKIVLHPAGGVIPQLSIVTAWIASVSEDVRKELIRTEPLLLLRADLTEWDESDLRDLTRSVLLALEQNLADDFGVSTFYEKLNHPGLAEQLRPFIRDPSKNACSRRAAISIAKHCKLHVLQRELLELALDSRADPHLRGRAVDALSTCGDATVLQQLLPLAKGDLGDDPENEIKGYALELLWPDNLSADELFDLVTRPCEGFIGSYVWFLTKTLPSTLTRHHMPAALRWATSLGPEGTQVADFHVRSLADSIFVRAWQLSDPEILDLLVNYVLTRLRPYNDLFGGTGMREREAFYANLPADPRRREFLYVAAQRDLDALDVSNLRRSGFVAESDLQWLLDLSPASSGCDPKCKPAVLCELIFQIADLMNSEHFDAIYTAAQLWPDLRRRYRSVFEGIPLDSDDAKRLRATHEEMRSFEVKRRRQAIAPEPEKSADTQLELFESGDWNAWWRLNLFLGLSSASMSYMEVDLTYSIAGMPGWLNADAYKKQRILKAASKYLDVAETSISKWIGMNPFTPQRPDIAAFRAMLLLREFDEPLYRAISRETWAKWAPAVVVIAWMANADRTERESEVIRDALAAAPNEFVGAVREIMRAERKRAAEAANQSSAPMRGASFLFLRQLKECWQNDVFREAIFSELKDDNNSEDQFSCLLEILLEKDSIPARELATAYLDDQQKQRYWNTIAVALATHRPGDAWGRVWSLVNADHSFGETFFLDIARHFRFDGNLFDGLSEQQLAEVYVYLERRFPRQEDPQHPAGQPHYSGPRESLMHFRDTLPQHIATRGTVGAVRAIRWIIGQLPELPWLSFRLREAERIMWMKTWLPLSVRELFNLCDFEDRVIVRSAEDLCELVVRSLRAYERELHGEQTPVRALWDRQAGGASFRPVEEDAFSDNVRLFLRRELAESGIVVNREVEVARVPGAPIGKRTDIRIDAVRHSPSEDSHDAITAVVESKGCWNSELFSALKDQLFSEYMVRLQAPVGIYLVAWFDKAKWDRADRRRGEAPDLTPSEIQQRLDEAAVKEIPQGYLVRPVVVDCHAP